MRTGERRRRLPNWAIGLVLMIFLAAGSVYAFTKSVPWSNKYEVKAVFSSAANIRTSSPVRIAGVNVGEVTSIEHLQPDEASDLTAQTSDDPVVPGSVPPSATVVTMELEDSALPLHTDATMKLRPRLFLEGNLFVQLQPGSPNAETVDSGYTIPVSQTSIAVQLDQVLTTLQSDVRSDLQTLLDELGTAFDEGGAEGFREIYRTSPGAFRYTAEVNEAFLGTDPHDLSNLIVNLDSTLDALNQGSEIQDLVTNLQTVLGSFAANSSEVEEAIRVLPEVLQEGEPALASLNDSFPAVRAFASEALPGVRSTPETLDAATPLLAQVRGLVSKPELRGLVSDLRPTIPRLARLARTTTPFLRQGRLLSSCFNEVIIPWSNQTIDDMDTPATGRIYQELGYGLAGIAGESRSGDANGPYIRVLAGGGENTVVFPDSIQEGGVTQDAVGITPEPLEGTIPDIDSSLKTPFRPDVRCETQEPPDLDAGDPGAAPQQSTAPALPRSSTVTPELTDAVESANDTFGLVEKLAARGRTKESLELKDDALDDVNEELANMLGWDFILPLLDEEPTR